MSANKHKFDPHKVLLKIKKSKLSKDAMEKELENACRVIIGLRHDLGSLLMILDDQVKTRQFWITGKVDY